MELIELPYRDFESRIAVDASPFFSALLIGKDGALKCIVPTFDDGPPARAMHAYQYLVELVRVLPEDARNRMSALSQDFALLQGEDKPSDVPSIAWQSKKNWANVRLAPDLYYYLAQGYEADHLAVPAWRERKSQAIWRGSSTGITAMRFDQLPSLPRYQLCERSAMAPALLDAKLTAVVQPATPEDEQQITALLEDRGLIGEFLQMEAMAGYKMLIDIDGNANAWNAMARFRLGCCVLRVESDWHQWFSGRLSPWEHFVPVAADLSDLETRLEWCLQHDQEAKQIAERGRAFAMAMRYDDEMTRAARLLIPA